MLYFSEHEDECFDCGDGGELIMCSKTGCSKCYHLSCLTIDKIPHGDWLCPWHFCDDCGKAAFLRCDECSNSFCLAHAPGQITKTANGRYLCDQHPDGGLDKSDVSSDNTSTNIPIDPNVTTEENGNTINILTKPDSVFTNADDEPPNPTSVSTNPNDVPTEPSCELGPTTTQKSPTGNSFNLTTIPLMGPSSVPTNPGSDAMNPNITPENHTCDLANIVSDDDNTRTNTFHGTGNVHKGLVNDTMNNTEDSPMS